MSREINGTIYKFDGLTPWAGARLVFSLLADTAAGNDAVWPKWAKTVQAGADGTIPAGLELDTPPTGSWLYRLKIEENTPLDFYLSQGDGSALSVSDIVTLAGATGSSAGTPQQEMLLDLYTDAQTAVAGQVLTADGAGGADWEDAAESGIPEPTSDGLWARMRASGVGSWLAATTVGAAVFAAVSEAAARGAIGAAASAGAGTAGELATIDGSGNAVRSGVDAETVTLDPSANGIYLRQRVEFPPNPPASVWVAPTTVGYNVAFAADRATARSAIGLGTIATQAANNVAITGGAISGITDLDIADGGTGASTVDGARANLGLAAVTMPPRRIDHAQFTWSTADVLGTGGWADLVKSVIDIRSGATANSRVRLRPNTDKLAIGNNATGFVNWSKRVVFSIGVIFQTNVATGLFRYLAGKDTTSAYGLAATGNYVGFELGASYRLTGFFVCKAGVVTSIPVIVDSLAGKMITIVSENGTVNFYVDGVLAASTTNGPTAAGTGTLNLECENGVTAGNYIVQLWSQSEGH